MTFLEVQNKVMAALGTVSESSETSPGLTYEMLLRAKKAMEVYGMAGEMTAGEVRERQMMRGIDPRMEDRWRSAPSIVRDNFDPIELEDRFRMGHSHGRIEMEAMDRERRRDRDRRREMEMRINPPVMFGGGGSGGSAGGGGGLSAAFAEQFSRQIDENIMSAFLLPEVAQPKSKFPEYSEEKFEKMGKEPVVKEIMPGAVMLTKEQRTERIRLYLEDKK